MQWRGVERDDYVPRKGMRTFVDLLSNEGGFELCDYGDSFHLFQGKMFLGRYSTLAVAKRTAKSLYEGKLARMPNRVKWSIICPRWSVVRSCKEKRDQKWRLK